MVTKWDEIKQCYNLRKPPNIIRTNYGGLYKNAFPKKRVIVCFTYIILFSNYRILFTLSSLAGKQLITTHAYKRMNTLNTDQSSLLAY